MNKKLLEVLVCPACKGPLVWQESKQELWCRADKLAYPIEEDMPIMLAERARELSLDELEAMR